MLPFFLYFIFCLPSILFEVEYSTILEDREGKLLSAQIAPDGQWRFPEIKHVPKKFEQALLHFEDEYFYWHLGVNPISISKAFYQNIQSGKVKRGGSTITMQLMRMSRGNKSRNVWQKLIEVIWAVRAELRYSKKELLQLYASHAPFGGNVVGLEAASWRYFKRSPEKLSWAEACMLAVLPNSPSLIHLKRNRGKLKQKRDQLLFKLKEEEVIDEETYQLALLEEIPLHPKTLPQNGKHVIEFLKKEEGKRNRISSSIDARLQINTQRILQDFYQRNRENFIQNGAVVIIHNKTKQLLAYVGNTNHPQNKFQNYVDCASAPRSSGSILKPFLYASCIQKNSITPKQFVQDLPIQYGGYVPKNYDNKFRGLVNADEALARSLNVPAVNLLQDHGVPEFKNLLNRLGFQSVNRAPETYGLSLILGGAEVRLIDLAKVYSGMAYQLNQLDVSKAYVSNPYTLLNLDTSGVQNKETNTPIYGYGELYFTTKALQKVNRPDEELGWERYSISNNISWKTGTSYGNRDAWAVGYTPNYTVAVWIGNASGEGRRGLTGVNYAAPVMFNVFSLLNDNETFPVPEAYLYETSMCKVSGMKADKDCPKEEQYFMLNNQNTGLCKYHQKLWVTEDKRYQVSKGCYKNAKEKVYLNLSASEAYYYKNSSINYEANPPWHPNCSKENKQVLEFIYPRNHHIIEIPRDLDGEKGEFVFEVAHTNLSSLVYWQINNRFIKKTEDIHKINILLEPGLYTITATDQKGNSITKKVEVVE